MEFRIVAYVTENYDCRLNFFVNSLEHGCNQIMKFIEGDMQYRDHQFNYDLECREGEEEFIPWSDENYPCVGVKVFEMMKEEENEKA